MKTIEIKVVNAGKCMICGKPIKIVVHRDYGKLPNICFCRECEPELKHDRKRLKSKEGGRNERETDFIQYRNGKSNS